MFLFRLDTLYETMRRGCHSIRLGISFRSFCSIFLHRRHRNFTLDRARAIQRSVRIVKPQPVETLVELLGKTFAHQDSVDTIRQLCIGECRDAFVSFRLIGFKSSLISVFIICRHILDSLLTCLIPFIISW